MPNDISNLFNFPEDAEIEALWQSTQTRAKDWQECKRKIQNRITDLSYDIMNLELSLDDSKSAVNFMVISPGHLPRRSWIRFKLGLAADRHQELLRSKRDCRQCKIKSLDGKRQSMKRYKELLDQTLRDKITADSKDVDSIEAMVKLRDRPTSERRAAMAQEVSQHSQDLLESFKKLEAAIAHHKATKQKLDEAKRALEKLDASDRTTEKA